MVNMPQPTVDHIQAFVGCCVITTYRQEKHERRKRGETEYESECVRLRNVSATNSERFEVPTRRTIQGEYGIICNCLRSRTRHWWRRHRLSPHCLPLPNGHEVPTHQHALIHWCVRLVSTRAFPRRGLAPAPSKLKPVASIKSNDGW